MAVRQSAALHLAPLTIRVALGLIFLYYGAGKVLFSDFQLSAEQELRLVTLGVLEARPDGPQPPAPIDASGDTRAAPAFGLIRVQDEGGGGPAGDAQDAVEEAVDDALDAIAEQLDGAEQADGADAGGATEGRSVRRLYGLVFPMDAAAHAPPLRRPARVRAVRLLRPVELLRDRIERVVHRLLDR
ncbi:MAG: hypothetical protein AAGH64_12380, partial [Planctomycetota bacterium]